MLRRLRQLAPVLAACALVLAQAPASSAQDLVAKGRALFNDTKVSGVGTRQAYSWAGTAPSLAANIRGIIVNRMKGAEPSPETLDALVEFLKIL
jgi:hypothetical protein